MGDAKRGRKKRPTLYRFCLRYAYILCLYSLIHRPLGWIVASDGGFAKRSKYHNKCSLFRWKHVRDTHIRAVRHRSYLLQIYAKARDHRHVWFVSSAKTKNRGKEKRPTLTTTRCSIKSTRADVSANYCHFHLISFPPSMLGALVQSAADFPVGTYI